MKNLNTIVIILAACILQACHSGVKTGMKSDSSADTAADVDSDSVNAVHDTATTLNLVVDRDDSLFAVEAANGNISEIAMGKLAITKGKNKKVKNFGLMMVKDHGKANDKLSAIAKMKGIKLPTAPDTSGKKMIAILSKKWGGEFDKAYINMMMEDHQQDVKTFAMEAKKIQDPELKNFATKTLPVLQNHLDAITAIHDSMNQ